MTRVVFGGQEVESIIIIIIGLRYYQHDLQLILESDFFGVSSLD